MLKWCEGWSGGSRKRSIEKWSRKRRSNGGSSGRTRLKAGSFNFAISLSQVIEAIGGQGPIAMRMIKITLSSSNSLPSSPSSTPGNAPQSNRKPPIPATRSMYKRERKERDRNGPSLGIINAHQQVLHCPLIMMRRGNRVRKKRRRNISRNANR